MIGEIINVVLILVITILYQRSMDAGRFSKLWLPFVAIKLLASCAFVFLYYKEFGGGDMAYYFQDAQAYRKAGIIPDLFHQLPPKVLVQELHFNFDRSAIFMAKLVAIFNYLGNNIWLTAANIALCSSLIIFSCITSMQRIDKDKSAIFCIAFFGYPSLVFWGSGVTKEAIIFPLLLFLFATSYHYLKSERTISIRKWILVLISCVLIWKLKYFVAAVVIPIFLSSILTILLSPKLKVQGAILWIALIAAQLLVVSNLHYNLSPHHLLEALVETNSIMWDASDPKRAIGYEGLTPTLPSLLSHFPKALVVGLVFPLPWLAWNFLSMAVSIENTLLLILIIFGVYSAVRQKSWTSLTIHVFALFLFISFLAGMIALATPNLGSLARYRIVYSPFLVFLLLIPIRDYLAAHFEREKS